MKNTLVYSDESGDMRRKTGKRAVPSQPPGIKNDGIIRVQRERAGRGGKTATVVYGLSLASEKLSELGSRLKRACGAGGSVKDGNIIIQGDKVDAVLSFLTDEGFPAKKAGG